MPGFTTHYLFGVNTYKKLEKESLKKDIYENPNVYSLGLQGPDIFFYYLPSYVFRKNNIGSVTHTKDTNRFFRYLIKSTYLFQHEEETEIARAYIAGFMGHYILDSSCHPYVYARTRLEEKNNAYHGRHMNLETDIDTELLHFYKQIPPSDFRKDVTIKLTKEQMDVVATMLQYAYSKVYPIFKIGDASLRLAIRSMGFGLRFLHDPKGKKKVVVRKIEGVTMGYPVLSAMIASDSLQFYKDPLNTCHRSWKNPWDTEKVLKTSMFDMMEQAEKEYLCILTLLQRLFETEENTSIEKQRLRRLLNVLGNKSYHTGMEE